VELSIRQYLNVVFQAHLAIEELLLLPFNILIKHFYDILKVQRQHEYTVGIVMNTESITK